MNFAKDVVRVYRSWDKFERKFDEHGSGIVDFDLAPDKTDHIAFSSRLEILHELEQCLLLVENSPYLSAKICSSICYLRTLMGQIVPFEKYVHCTVGMIPYEFPKDPVERQKQKVVALFDAFNIGFDRKHTRHFEKKMRVANADDIQASILSAKDEALEKVTQFLDLPPLAPLRILFAQSDSYWDTWVTGSFTDGITLSINLHPRSRWYKGKPGLLMYHEICGHALHMSCWIHAIKTRKLNSAYGITTVHSPEQFVIEGLAQTITDMLLPDDELSPEVKLAREYERYRHYLYNNAQVRINQGEAIESIHGYILNALPFEPPSTIEAEIRDRSLKPLFRGYQYVYGLSDLYFMENIVTLSLESKMKIVPLLYEVPMTPSMLQTIIETK